jgi:decaprenylphospho-beta-D-erythro-pentofuranosid-2-ulose 2-reductase
VIDALGAPQSVLVLGATSDIAAATLTRLAGLGRLRRAVLAARPSAALDCAADRARGLSVADVTTVTFDAHEPQSVSRVVAEAFAGGDVDVVLVAFGVLPDQQEALQHLEIALDNAQVNYVGALAACLAAADALRCQGHGTLVVLSSVAAERPRRSNFVYGSAKAGLDALATGLGDELCGSGASVIVVRPGFVKTKMTAGLRPAPLSTTPEAVAAAISGALRRGTATVWVPGPLRYVMAMLRHVPRTLFRRLPL